MRMFPIFLTRVDFGHTVFANFDRSGHTISNSMYTKAVVTKIDADRKGQKSHEMLVLAFKDIGYIFYLFIFFLARLGYRSAHCIQRGFMLSFTEVSPGLKQ